MFKYATGIAGSTETGQKVTPKNIRQLPPGSVVDLKEGKLIFLHGRLWLWIDGCAPRYDTIDNFYDKLSGATAGHVAPTQ